MGEAAPDRGTAHVISLSPCGDTTWLSTFMPISKTGSLVGKGLDQVHYSLGVQQALTCLPDSVTN